MSSFVDQFFLGPNPADVLAHYPWRPEEHKGFDCPYKYDTWKLCSKYFYPIIEAYYSVNKRMEDQVCQAAILLADKFALKTKTLKSYEIDDLGFVLMRARLETLLSHPNFILEDAAIEVLKRLRDIKNNQPWGYKMWSPSAVGAEQVNAFMRIVNTDDLWTGESSNMSILFTAIGHVLRKLSLEKKLLLEVAEVRIAILDRNAASRHRTHTVECESLFERKEFTEFKDADDPNSVIGKLKLVITEKDYWQTPHAC